MFMTSLFFFKFSVGVIDIFLTPSQLKYLQSMNQIGSLPGKAVKRPNVIRRLAF